MALIVGISGIRGIVGPDLTPEVVVKYGSAFAEYVNRGPIVIGRDGRTTGKGIAHILSSTLLAMGSDVIALGVCPTPTVQLGVERLHAAGGVSVTASHNPAEWNGLKFVGPTGLFLDTDENRAFWNIAEKPTRDYAAWNGLGNHTVESSFLEAHIREVLNLPYLKPQAIRQRRLKVVVDCVNGSGGVIVPRLLRELGCAVIEMNCDASGLFAHAPEPLPENLSDLMTRVQTEHADMGLAIDPDGDRLALIDENGKPFGEEYTIATAVKFVLEQQSGPSEGRKVVVNLSTTRAVNDIARAYGAEVIRTAVGEIHVAKKMKEVGAAVGGEGSGGVILPDVHLGRDALVGIALVLQQLVNFGGTLSELKNTLPQYAITKGTVEMRSANPTDALQRIADRHGRNGTMTTVDGVKFDFADSWVHLRKSNTEPIMRIIAEAATQQAADELVNRFTAELLKG
jgi:phosphomannomutase